MKNRTQPHLAVKSIIFIQNLISFSIIIKSNFSMKKFLFTALTIVFALNLYSFIDAEKKPWNIPASYRAMRIPNKGDAAGIALGKILYTKHCKSCHGGGKGNGAKAASLNTKMDDFTTPFFKSLPDGSKYYMSFVGRDEMPNFEKKIVSEEERWAIINFINTL